MNADSIALSVIVPFRNAGHHFERLLTSIATQRLSVPWEVILVDNGSTDNSRQVADRFLTTPAWRVVEAVARPNAAYARNVGTSVASSERLMFVDADDEIAPGYLAAMYAAMDEHDFVTSRVDSVSLNPEWVRTAHGEPWQETSIGTFFGFLPATGINIGVGRRLVEQIDGFPEAYPGSQDIAFSWRAQLHGASLVLVRDATYLYRYRDSLIGLYRQCVNWGCSNVLLYRDFRSAGMPPRRLGVGLREWADVAGGLVRARQRSELAPFIVRLGYCVGRLKGCIRYRVLYF